MTLVEDYVGSEEIAELLGLIQNKEALLASMPDSSPESVQVLENWENSGIELTFSGAEIEILNFAIEILGQAIGRQFIPEPGRQVYDYFKKVTDKLDVAIEKMINLYEV